MKEKSKDARLCVSEEINRKKEKQLIGIMRSVSVVLIVMLSMNCVTTSYTPEGIDKTLQDSARYAKNKKLKYRVNLSFIRNPTVEKKWNEKLKEELNLCFIHDPSSPIEVNVEHYMDDNEVNLGLALLPTPIPFFPMSLERRNVNTRIKFNNKISEIKIIIDSNKYITFPSTIILLMTPLVTLLLSSDVASRKEQSLLFNLPYYIKEEVVKIAPPELAVYPDNPLYEPTNAKSNTASTPTSGFTDTVVLKNGDFIENVKATVTIDSLIVTDANGKTTVYKKSQVLTVKRK